MARYFSGEALYGDDFGPDRLDAWYRDEQEGYSSLEFDDARNPVYNYHAQNRQCLFSALPRARRFEHALGIGSAFAEEFEPIADRIGDLVVLDPSTKFPRSEVHGLPVRYVAPQASGIMPFADRGFDLVTSLGTLHHVPNVSTVIREAARVMRSDGYLLIREPITSMGDWRQPRAGLTLNERGIPLSLFRRFIAAAGLQVVSERLTAFGPMGKVGRVLRLNTYNSPVMTRIDGWLCQAFAFNTRYHRETFLQKLGPVSVAYVLRKP